VELVVSLCWLAAVGVLVYRSAKQGLAFRRLQPAPVPADAPAVAIIIPARDEAEDIGDCLASILAQTYPRDRLSIIVVDDHSADGTAEIVRLFAAADPRIRLIEAPPLRSGWLGKPSACQAGVDAAPVSEFLLFVDADVVLDPPAIASAVAAAVPPGSDLLSCSPRQKLATSAERLVIPAGLYLLAFVQNLDNVASPDKRDVSVSGKFMLLRRDAYDEVGGFAAVHDSIVEDLALARTLKWSGHRVAFLGGDRLMATQMYSGWKTLWPGFAKNAVDMYGGIAATLAIGTLAIILSWAAYAIPAILAVSYAVLHSAEHLAALVIAGVASAVALAFHLAGAIFMKVPPWYGLIFPVGYTAGALIAFDSVRRRLTGRTEWKGRTYP